MDGLLDSLTIQQLSLYAVYVPRADLWPGDDYVAVFSRPVPKAGVIAEGVFISDGRIIGLLYAPSCGIVSWPNGKTPIEGFSPVRRRKSSASVATVSPTSSQ